jgi:hypothetical protein
MILQRPLTLHAHNAILIAVSPLLMVVPFVLSADPGVGFLTFFVGAVLLGVALTSTSPRRAVPLHAHKGLELALGISLVLIGTFGGLIDGVSAVTVFLVGFGAAQIALTAATRYTARGA